MSSRDLASWLVRNPRFRWRDGMLDRHGARMVLEAWTHPAVTAPDASVGLNLDDPGTGGVLLSLLDEEGALSDVVRVGDGWIVAIRVGEEIEGFHGESLGVAAAFALLAAWGEDLEPYREVEVA